MDKTYLQINFTNFVTVTVMAFVGIIAFGMLSAAIKSKFGGAANGSE